MAEKRCGACSKKKKQQARKLVNAIKDGLTFDEAVRFAGLGNFKMTANYNLFLNTITKSERARGIIDKVVWE